MQSSASIYCKTGGEPYEPDSIMTDILTLSSKRHDNRSRRDRTQSRNAQWVAQVPSLADAYLLWKLRNTATDVSSSARPAATEALPGDTAGTGAPADPLAGAGNPATDEGRASAASGPDARTWDVFVIDFFSESVPLYD